MVTSPLKVSALIRAAPPPISKVNFLLVDEPIPCSPGRSVIGNWLSMPPFQVEKVSWRARLALDVEVHVARVRDELVAARSDRSGRRR
jgi:hypothetical protein